MAQTKTGDTVRVVYTGTLVDGTTFDSTNERGPMQFKLGDGEVIAGFDSAVTGMSPGENKSVSIAPENAYGERDNEIVQTVPRSAVPTEIELAEGLVLEVQDPSGQTFGLTVIEFDDENVTLDANHPLAGETLNFDIELVEIV